MREAPARRGLIALQVHTGSSANLHGDVRERNTARRATLSTVTIILICFPAAWRSASRFISNTQEQWGEFCSRRAHACGSLARSRAPEKRSHLLCAKQVYPSRFSLFQESHLISYWPMKQCRVRGKWTINLCNVIRGLSAVSKCLHRQPSKPAVKRILQKRNLSRAGLSLYLSPARQQQGIKHIIFQRSVHFSYRLAFYVLCTPAQGRTAVWAPHPL